MANKRKRFDRILSFIPIRVGRCTIRAGDDVYAWSRTMPAWTSARLGRPISVQLGWTYLVRLGGKRRKPRPLCGPPAPARPHPLRDALQLDVRELVTPAHPHTTRVETKRVLARGALESHLLIAAVARHREGDAA